MRPEDNPLDLNNLPEDYPRDGKQVFDDSSSSSGYRKKKSGAKDGKDEGCKVYECRFCSLKFCKSQALGGHMNRHRQERETETLNRARQLVFSNDNIAAQAPHLGYHPGGNIGDPFRPVYPPRFFSGSSSTILPQAQPPHQPYLYTSPSRLPPYTSQYPPPHQQPINDYYIGHLLNDNSQTYMGASESSYTCIGAPVGHGGFGPGPSRGLEGSGRDHHEEGSNWGRGYARGGGGSHHPNSSINRFQDGF